MIELRPRVVGSVEIRLGPKATEPIVLPAFDPAQLDAIEESAAIGGVTVVSPGVYILLRERR